MILETYGFLYLLFIPASGCGKTKIFMKFKAENIVLKKKDIKPNLFSFCFKYSKY